MHGMVWMSFHITLWHPRPKVMRKTPIGTRRRNGHSSSMGRSKSSDSCENVFKRKRQQSHQTQISLKHKIFSTKIFGQISAKLFTDELRPEFLEGSGSPYNREKIQVELNQGSKASDSYELNYNNITPQLPLKQTVLTNSAEFCKVVSAEELLSELLKASIQRLKPRKRCRKEELRDEVATLGEIQTGKRSVTTSVTVRRRRICASNQQLEIL